MQVFSKLQTGRVPSIEELFTSLEAAMGEASPVHS